MADLTSLHETVSLVISTVTAAGIVALIAFGRKIIGLPREMLIVKAALFRLLRSNKLQGVALTKIAECQKEGTKNGKCDEAASAVSEDQEKTDRFLTAAALGKFDTVEEELKP
jgi:hypothetical protein